MYEKVTAFVAIENEKYIIILVPLDRKLYDLHMDDSKRTIRNITVKNSPMHYIVPDERQQFWKLRWKPNPGFDADETKFLYLVKNFFNKDMNEQIIMENIGRGKNDGID
jgi:hypothetical protein